MTAYMTLGYAIALCEARSSLIALADRTQTFEESVHFEHLLLAIDLIYEDYPGCHPVTGAQDDLSTDSKPLWTNSSPGVRTVCAWN